MISPEKKLHRFFIPHIPETASLELTDPKLVHHVRTVLRYENGESFIIFAAGGNDIVVTITGISKKSISVSVIRTIPARPHPARDVIAAISIIKRDLFELVVQKLTELGVTAVVPVRSDRTIKQSVRIDRLEMIAIEAMEQSGGNVPVRIYEPMILQDCLAAFPYPSVVCDPRTTGIFEGEQKVVMYIGPEGGWSPADLDTFEHHGTYTMTLGTTILRTETAAIVGAYELMRTPQ